MDTIKVLIADDHQIIIDGLKSLINAEKNIELVGEASNGKEAIDLLKIINADVVLLDINMPVLNGIETMKCIKSDFPDIKVIILSMHNESSLIKNLIELGTDGYLIKNCDQDELREAIYKVGSGQKYFSSEVTLSLLNKTSGIKSAIGDDPTLASLTDREIEILKLITRGLTNKEIGEKLFISHRTVDTHRTNLMKKLEVNNIAGLIRFAIRNGFIE
ncbi:MAG: response regulator transcription factor [Bacteroidales bacterium]